MAFGQDELKSGSMYSGKKIVVVMPAYNAAKTVTVTVDSHYFAIFNASKNSWEIVPGDYQLMIGGSSDALPLKQTLHLEGELLPPLLAD